VGAELKDIWDIWRSFAASLAIRGGVAYSRPDPFIPKAECPGCSGTAPVHPPLCLPARLASARRSTARRSPRCAPASSRASCSRRRTTSKTSLCISAFKLWMRGRMPGSKVSFGRSPGLLKGRFPHLPAWIVQVSAIAFAILCHPFVAFFRPIPSSSALVRLKWKEGGHTNDHVATFSGAHVSKKQVRSVRRVPLKRVLSFGEGAFEWINADEIGRLRLSWE
jgi:hypothetical protein